MNSYDLGDYFNQKVFFWGGDFFGDLTDLTSTGASESGSHSHFMGRVIIVNRELKQFWWYPLVI